MELAFYWTMRTIILLEVAGICGLILWMLLTCVFSSFCWRFLWYFYEVPILGLHIYFLSGEPRGVCGEFWCVVYWAAQIGLLPLAMTPVIYETSLNRGFAKLWRRASMLKVHAVMLVITTVAMFVMVNLTKLEVRSQEVWGELRSIVKSNPVLGDPWRNRRTPATSDANVQGQTAE